MIFIVMIDVEEFGAIKLIFENTKLAIRTI